jgi:nicotinamide mononucleotide (NMN) deamidase PncC|tara:strand:- start:3017 stop:4312 length:1296 start_codon:yes stop_codon:yes gene_type:complete
MNASVLTTCDSLATDVSQDDLSPPADGLARRVLNPCLVSDILPLEYGWGSVLLSQLVEGIHASPVSLVMAVTGGGSDAIAQLLQIPGASRTVLEATVPYHPSALTQYLQSAPDNSCSLATARSMAMVAFQRALQLAPERDPEELAGVACTASLATERQKRGDHRVHIALQTCQQSAASSLLFNKGARTRAEEEEVTRSLLLNEIAALCGVERGLAVELLRGEEIDRPIATARPLWRELMIGELDAVCDGRPDAPLPATLFPGAFNPLHEGHELMAAIAADVTGSTPALEISITNVDKPPLDYDQMERRTQQVDPKFDLWFTRAATFATKAGLFPGVTFVVGADTIKRIADPVYYGDDLTNRDTAIRSIRDLGCRFLVFGRKQGSQFESLPDIVLPSSLQEICREVPRDRFRVDISSTELRERAVQSAQMTK